MGVLDKLNSATRARRTHTLCLDAALQAEHDRLSNGIADATSADKIQASLASVQANLKVLVDQLEEVRGRMTDSLVTFTIEQMEWTERIALQSKHPPRDGQILDQLRGYNLETFLPAIIKGSTVSVEDADGDTETEVPDESWDALFKALNFGGMNRLSALALAVNDQDTEVPISARSLLGSQDSGASLGQPSPGQESPPSDSTGGSRPTSPRSSTTKKATAAKRTAKKATSASKGSPTAT